MTKKITSAKFIDSSLLGVFMFVLGVLLNSVNSQTIDNECGAINIPKGLAIEGHQTLKGFWPFAVGVYEIKDYKLFCGGSLISRKHVLTAAHCIQDKSIGLKYAPAEIAVLLAAYTILAQLKGGLQHANVTDIRIHPNWEEFNKTILDADVAILILSESVTLTDDIQVVCLPSDDGVINHTKGFVVGWELVRQTPQHSIINVMNNSSCYASDNLSLYSFLSPRTFCGDGGNVTLMKKVSGGGFYMRTGSAWVQQGIAVSITNGTGDLMGQEIIFLMNVTSFKSWIVDTVRQSGGVVGEALSGKINLDCEFIYLYYSYACVAHGLSLQSKNFGIDTLTGSHQSVNESNAKVELMQFHNGTMFYLMNGLGKFFPNLKSIFVGYSDEISLYTKLIGRSNFQNMEKLFEIVIHRSDIETISEDVLWDLPSLERFQLDGKLKELPDRIFEKNAKLTEVYLASNVLEFLPRQLFKNNLNLNWVNFKDNSLKFIETDFMHFEHIKYIFLAGNVCIDKDFNKTDVQFEDQYEDPNVNTDSNQVGRVIDLQRLIYSNCSFIPQ